MTSQWLPRKSCSFTQNDIERMLDELGFVFSVFGRVTGQLHYASIRAPVESGIYYLVGDARLPSVVAHSLILAEKGSECPRVGNAYITLENPKLAFYKLMRACEEEQSEVTEIHPTAVIAEGSEISAGVNVGPFCVIESGVRIESDCRLEAHVVIRSGTQIGRRTRIESHSTIGATGVAWMWDENGRDRIIQPQTGGVVIGEDVFIGSDVAVVRGSVNEMTQVGDGTLIAHGSKIGHGCRLGKQVHMANNVSVAGNVDVRERVFLGSGAVVRPHVCIAARVVVGAGAVVVCDLDVEDAVVGGVPAVPLKRVRAQMAGVPENPKFKKVQ